MLLCEARGTKTITQKPIHVLTVHYMDRTAYWYEYDENGNNTYCRTVTIKKNDRDNRKFIYDPMSCKIEDTKDKRVTLREYHGTFIDNKIQKVKQYKNGVLDKTYIYAYADDGSYSVTTVDTNNEDIVRVRHYASGLKHYLEEDITIEKGSVVSRRKFENFYDVNGNFIKEIQDFNGKITTYEYINDVKGEDRKHLHIHHLDDNRILDIYYKYNGDGNLVEIVNGYQTTTIKYDYNRKATSRFIEAYGKRKLEEFCMVMK